MSKDKLSTRLIRRTLLLLGGMYLFNKFVTVNSARKKKLTCSSSDFYNWKDLKVYYKVRGSGSPLLLLHDIHPAASAYEWSLVEDLLARKHTVYVLDFPGCGRSDKPQDLYTNFFFVELIRDFIRDHKIEKADIVASNLSSAVALMTGKYAPDCVGDLILINPPSVRETAQVPDIISKAKKAVFELPFFGDFVYNLLSARSEIDYAFTEHYFYNPFHDNEDLVDTYYESAHLGKGNGRFLAASLVGNYVNINLEHAIKSYDGKVSIIEGSDVKNGGSNVHEWITLNPSIKRDFIPHTKELPHLEEPDKTVAMIESMLSK